MDTNELIKALAADTRPPAPSLSSVWWGAVGLGIGLAAAVFFALLGPRPDIAAAAETPRFLFKFVVTITLAVSAFGVARALSRPGEAWRKAVARRQALGHDLRLRLGAPPTPTHCPGDHLEPPNLTNLRVYPTVKS